MGRYSHPNSRYGYWLLKDKTFINLVDEDVLAYIRLVPRHEGALRIAQLNTPLGDIFTTMLLV
jgi:hypothetical protein